MHLLMLAQFLAPALLTQAPPAVPAQVQQADQIVAAPQVPVGQVPPAPRDQAQNAFRKWLQEQHPVIMVAPKVTLAPGQACAIPLVNVLRTDPHDRIVVAPRRFQTFEPKAPQVKVPAPSCDDVKR
ncbi:MAG TPA: hypothetical protein VLY04_09140 [Bryobacteraceae bacterium]|nr:hypothetical protein [Bryobacteraceae bacterium]